MELDFCLRVFFSLCLLFSLGTGFPYPRTGDKYPYTGNWMGAGGANTESVHSAGAGGFGSEPTYEATSFVETQGSFTGPEAFPHSPAVVSAPSGVETYPSTHTYEAPAVSAPAGHEYMTGPSTHTYEAPAVSAPAGHEYMTGPSTHTYEAPAGPEYMAYPSTNTYEAPAVPAPAGPESMAYPGGSSPQDEHATGGFPEWFPRPNWGGLSSFSAAGVGESEGLLGESEGQPQETSPPAPSSYIVQSLNGYQRARSFQSHTRYSPDVFMPMASTDAKSAPRPSRPVAGPKGKSY